MYKLRSLAVAALAVLAATILTNRADAMTISTPAGLRGAIEDVAVTDKVHCVPGWLHHNWSAYGPTWDGCYRTGRIWAPRLFLGHRFHRHQRVHFGSRFVGSQRFVSSHRFVGTSRFVGGQRFGGMRFGGGRRGH
jgi:hypothetical protein